MKWVYIGTNSKLIHGHVYDIQVYRSNGRLGPLLTQYVTDSDSRIYIIGLDIKSHDFKPLSEIREEKINSILE